MVSKQESQSLASQARDTCVQCTAYSLALSSAPNATSTTSLQRAYRQHHVRRQVVDKEGATVAAVTMPFCSAAWRTATCALSHTLLLASLLGGPC